MSRRKPDAYDAVIFALRGRYPRWWERIFPVEWVFIALALTVAALIAWVVS